MVGLRLGSFKRTLDQRKTGSWKSVLADHVTGQPQRSKPDCSYFFFKYSNKSKSRRGACPWPIAFQTACTNPKSERCSWRCGRMMSNARKTGNTLFGRSSSYSASFKLGYLQQNWVTDGLDECLDASSLFDPMLAKLDKLVPLRILITSRGRF
jgi:hypothetical protein